MSFKAHLPVADRKPVSDLPEQRGAGLYAFFVAHPMLLAPINPAPSGLVYIGMTRDDLHVRNHLLHPDSGFSTLRRSFGALLKDRLGLVAIARGRGQSESNFTNYRFTPDDEKRLSQWMSDHLLAVQWQVDRNAVIDIEADLIRHYCPPLNLQKNRGNPWRQHIMELRAACKRKAKVGVV